MPNATADKIFTQNQFFFFFFLIGDLKPWFKLFKDHKFNQRINLFDTIIQITDFNNWFEFANPATNREGSLCWGFSNFNAPPPKKKKSEQNKTF